MTSTDPNMTGGNREKAVHGIRGAVSGLHGTGEAIRGTFNQAVDETFGDKHGSMKNEAIANQGLAEINQGKLEKRNMDATPGTTGTGATGTGATYGGKNQYSNPASGTTAAGTTGSTNAGPHSSSLANKLDPISLSYVSCRKANLNHRVDSDLDNRGSTATTATTGTGASGYSTGHTGAGYGTGSTGAGYGSTNAGPHDSNTLNKLDPRVDSDLDGRAAGTGTGVGTGAGTGAGTGTGTGYGSSTTTTGYGNSTGYGSTNAGPHSSNLLNKLDPRVDSDQDGRAKGAGGHGPTGTQAARDGVAAYDNPTSGNYGPHSSGIANKMDPRVDSDMDNRAGRNY